MKPAFVALIVTTALAGGPSPASAAFQPGPGHVPFWLGLRANQQIDSHVARLLGNEAAVVVLRADLDAPPPEDFHGLAVRLRAVAPSTPLLTYSWASRLKGTGRAKESGSQTMEWLTSEPDLLVRSHSGKPLAGFGNVADPRYRNRTASAIAATIRRAEADGVALDLAIRTPQVRPQPLARRCKIEPAFCAHYATGMDLLFAELRRSLGRRPIIYNGLWNFGANMVEDQMTLLRYADATIVEYFGLNPRLKKQSGAGIGGFSEHILPYLQAMQRLPDGKRLFVYGRGPWHYTDYETDYRWQRYLYAAYLLASNPDTYFKYHASFQVPAHAGRAGGLDTYADWKLPLGAPKGNYRLRDGLYTRVFEYGLVLVAPDDSEGGTFALEQPYYSPEGEKLSGDLSLAAGTGLILLASPPHPPPKHRKIALQPLREWPAARWIRQGDDGAYLSLGAMAQSSVGEHDLLLENERAIHPYPTLRLKVRPRNEQAQLWIMAEVDDPQGRVRHVALVSSASAPSLAGNGPRPRFRAQSHKREKIPFISMPALRPNEWQELQFNGNEAILGDFAFRGWRYVRFAGPMDVAEASLWRSSER